MIKSDMTISEYKNLIDAKLSEYFKADDMPQKGLFDSMRYSLNAGGKRIRPILMLEFCAISGGDIDKALPAACAIEMLLTALSTMTCRAWTMMIFAAESLQIMLFTVNVRRFLQVTRFRLRLLELYFEANYLPPREQTALAYLPMLSAQTVCAVGNIWT